MTSCQPFSYQSLELLVVSCLSEYNRRSLSCNYKHVNYIVYIRMYVFTVVTIVFRNSGGECNS